MKMMRLVLEEVGPNGQGTNVVWEGWMDEKRMYLAFNKLDSVAASNGLRATSVNI